MGESVGGGGGGGGGAAEDFDLSLDKTFANLDFNPPDFTFSTGDAAEGVGRCCGVFVPAEIVPDWSGVLALTAVTGLGGAGTTTVGAG